MARLSEPGRGVCRRLAAVDHIERKFVLKRFASTVACSIASSSLTLHFAEGEASSKPRE